MWKIHLSLHWTHVESQPSYCQHLWRNSLWELLFACLLQIWLLIWDKIDSFTKENFTSSWERFFTYVPSRDCSNVFNCVQYKLKTVCFLLVFLLWENDSNLTSKKSIRQLSLQKGQISLQVNKYLYEQQ